MDFILIDDRNIDENEDLLLQFEKEVFIEAFPNIDERESFEDDIIPRIRHNNLSPDIPYSYCVMLKEGGEVVGGMVTDWYPRSSCLEVIYIVVKSASRDRSYGKVLLNEGIRQINGLLNSKGSAIKNVYKKTYHTYYSITHDVLQALFHIGKITSLIFYKKVELFTKL